MTLKHLFPLAALALPLAVAAQTSNDAAQNAANTKFDFETENWKTLGVFDTWEASPFRTGKLQGNVAVVDNPTTAEINPITGKPVNPSAKVLAVQRSRFGSNTFGARIVLKAPIALSPTPLYIHAWVHSPKAGRVLIAGLGKRKDRADQKDDVVQLAHISTSPLEVNQWKEIVVPAAANKGVELHSLLIVPDCESPHDLKEDFAAYIDNVEINNTTNPTLITGYYPINFDKGTRISRNDRHIDAIDFTIAGQKSTYNLPKPAMVYNEAGPNHRLFAQPGQVVKPNIHYTGTWMHSYVYIDYNQDGQFQTDGELVSYSFLDKKNSKGQTNLNPGSSLQSPEFTIPKDAKPGVYRLRVKVDYNTADAMGHAELEKNGGGFVDFLLNIHNGKATVNDHNLNGEITTLDGKPLTSLEVPYGKDFTIKMNPAPGFEHNGFVLKHGYIAKDSLDKDNSQWESITIPRSMFKADGTFTIPGRWMNDNVLIEGRFIQAGNYKPEPIPEWFSRFNVTAIDGKFFAAGTQWYSIQIGSQGYVIAGEANEKQNTLQPQTQIPLKETKVDAENQKHLWCFVGNNEEGYKLYNYYMGTNFVLAAPTNMGSNAGGSAFVRLVPANKIPSGYSAVWRFADSKNIKAEDAKVLYMYEDGKEANKVNNRDNKLAFWTGGQDAGSTLVIRPVKVTESPVTSVARVAFSSQDSEIYDLSGRRADTKTRGIFVMNGKKVVK